MKRFLPLVLVVLLFALASVAFAQTDTPVPPLPPLPTPAPITGADAGEVIGGGVSTLQALGLMGFLFAGLLIAFGRRIFRGFGGGGR